MNTLQKTMSDAIYFVAEEQMTYEEAYEAIITAIKMQKFEYERDGLIPTMDLLINDLENND